MHLILKFLTFLIIYDLNSNNIRIPTDEINGNDTSIDFFLQLYCQYYQHFQLLDF